MDAPESEGTTLTQCAESAQNAGTVLELFHAPVVGFLALNLQHKDSGHSEHWNARQNVGKAAEFFRAPRLGSETL